MKAVMIVHGNYEGALPAQPNKLGDWEIDCLSRESPLAIDSYDLIIVAPMAFYQAGEFVYRRQREIDLALRSGRQVVFLVHQALYSTDGGRRELLNYYLVPREIPIEAISLPGSAIADEFVEYTNRFGHAAVSFGGKGFNVLIKANEKPVGIVLEVWEGLIYFLPFQLEPKEPLNWNIFLSTLIAAISAYSQARKFRLPDWVQSVSLPAEEPLIRRISQIQKELSDLSVRQQRIAKYKAILVAKGNPLRDAVCDVLDTLLADVGFRCVKSDEMVEDFWIDDASGNHLMIAEVKGVDGSVRRTHINELDSHRERRDLNSKFPAFLVVNSSAKASSLAEKDERIHPDIIKHAVTNHVLITRSVDLFHLLRLFQESKLTSTSFADLLLEHCGWLSVEKDEAQVRK